MSGPLPQPAVLRPGRVPSVRRDRLDNGLAVIASRRTAVPLVELRLRIPVPPPTRAADLRRRLLAKTMLSGTSTADATTIARRLQAIGGSLVNGLFIDHFQNMARGHFKVRRLERKYGREEVQRVFQAI